MSHGEEVQYFQTDTHLFVGRSFPPLELMPKYYEILGNDRNVLIPSYRRREG